MGRTDWGQIVFDKQLAAAKSNHKKILTMFRVNPGIDAHTHKYIQTSTFNSKFGERIYDEKIKTWPCWLRPYDGFSR